jgi:hypothetical protein
MLTRRPPDGSKCTRKSKRTTARFSRLIQTLTPAVTRSQRADVKCVRCPQVDLQTMCPGRTPVKVVAGRLCKIPPS